MLFAKLATAKTVSFGPILDSLGVEYTSAVVGDLKISKNNGTPAALNGSATLTHKEVGVYELVLTTSDISEVGSLTITLSKTTYLAAPVHLTVLTADNYDSLIAGDIGPAYDVSRVGTGQQYATLTAWVAAVKTKTTPQAAECFAGNHGFLSLGSDWQPPATLIYAAPGCEAKPYGNNVSAATIGMVPSGTEGILLHDVSNVTLRNLYLYGRAAVNYTWLDIAASSTHMSGILLDRCVIEFDRGAKIIVSASGALSSVKAAMRKCTIHLLDHAPGYGVDPTTGILLMADAAVGSTATVHFSSDDNIIAADGDEAQAVWAVSSDTTGTTPIAITSTSTIGSVFVPGHVASTYHAGVIAKIAGADHSRDGNYVVLDTEETTDEEESPITVIYLKTGFSSGAGTQGTIATISSVTINRERDIAVGPSPCFVDEMDGNALLTVNSNYCVSTDATADDYGGVGNLTSEAAADVLHDVDTSFLVRPEFRARWLGQHFQSTDDRLPETAIAATTDIGTEVDSSTTGEVVSTDIYTGDVSYERAASTDLYTVIWKKNGLQVTPTASPAPQLQIVKRTDGTDLIAATNMTQVGSTAAYKLDSSSRQSRGQAYLAVATATIDGETRTWTQLVGRDII